MLKISDLNKLEWKEGRALLSMINGNTDKVHQTLQSMSVDELNRFTDALDKLAAKVDEEAIRRAEKRR